MPEVLSLLPFLAGAAVTLASVWLKSYLDARNQTQARREEEAFRKSEQRWQWAREFIKERLSPIESSFRELSVVCERVCLNFWRPGEGQLDRMAIQQQDADMNDLRQHLGDENLRLIEASISDEQLQELFASMIGMATQLIENYLLLPWTPVGKKEVGFQAYVQKALDDIQALRLKFNRRVETLLTTPESLAGEND